MRRPLAIAALHAVFLSALLSSGCAPERPAFNAETIARAKESDTSATVATIGERSLSFQTFSRRLNALPPYARVRYGTPEARLEFLQAQVTMELMAAAARKQGLADAPQVVDAVKDAVAERAESRELRSRIDAIAAPQGDDSTYEELTYEDRTRQARAAARAELVGQAEIALDEQALKRLRPPSSPGRTP